MFGVFLLSPALLREEAWISHLSLQERSPFVGGGLLLSDPRQMTLLKGLDEDFVAPETRSLSAALDSFRKRGDWVTRIEQQVWVTAKEQYGRTLTLEGPTGEALVPTARQPSHYMQEKAEVLWGTRTCSRSHRPVTGTWWLFLCSWIFCFSLLNHIATQS